MSKLIRFLLIAGLLSVAVLKAQELPYRISTEGLNTFNLNLLDDITPLPRFDSLVYENERQMHTLYKLRLFEKMYQTDNPSPVFDLHLGIYPYADYSYLDRASLEYGSLRHLYEFEHGYFGPARYPKASRHIRKSIYRDLLYPWQNAPQSKFQTYRVLYLITNFVYPGD